MKSEKQRMHIEKLNSLPRTKRWKSNISKSRIGEKNPFWRGEKVGYRGLHQWVRRRLKKPPKCECCKMVPPLDLANKGTYDRLLENWEWLCRRCHMTKDGRMKNLKQNKKET